MSVAGSRRKLDLSERMSTVGKTLEEGQVMSVDHPAYRMFADEVENELTRIAEREALRRTTAQPLIFTSSLTTDELADLAEAYPEFSVKVIPMNAACHAYWMANRACANEWLQVSVAQYASSVVHYGGQLTSQLLQRRRGVHLESDPADVVMVHEAHRAVVDVQRMYTDFVAVQSEYGLVLPHEEYRQYLAGRSYSMCSKPHTCAHRADALCVDLTATAMSPEQVALGMLQHGATLAYGLVVYCPEMMVQTAGQLGASGVTFRRTAASIEFEYPEGRAGVDAYPLDTWARWLASHTFCLGRQGSRHWFQLELLHTCECILRWRMVEVPQPVGPVQVRHVLDLPGMEEKVLVKSWRMKSGLSRDPMDKANWEPYNFLVADRVERRVREFAMQLSSDQFSRYAIKKQIRVVNNRWVVHGTTVVTAPMLDPQVIEDLTTAIYSVAFVDRYDSSRLSGEMMKALQACAAFGSMSRSQRVAAVAAAQLRSQVASGAGLLLTKLRSWLDDMVDWLSSAPGVASVSVMPAPTCVRFESEANSWRTVFKQSGERFYQPGTDRGEFPVLVPVPATAMAGTLVRAVRHYGVRRQVPGVSVGGAMGGLRDVVRLCTSLVNTRVDAGEGSDPAGDALVGEVSRGHLLDSEAASRHLMDFQVAERQDLETVGKFRHGHDPDPCHSLNSMYGESFPKLAGTRVEYDTYSLSLDPQDRTLAAPYLRMPNYFGLPPRSREYYVSRLHALNVPKRQNTAQELLTAVASRNMAAPALSLPQDETVIRNIWENFLNVACVEDAREKLSSYQADPVALEEGALRDWAKQANPDAVARVVDELRTTSKTLAEMSVSDYLVMLKSDVKPTLSEKPVTEVTAPQVIVYHEKAMSAMYSSMFRVLVRRFLSLLKPNFHVNLLKDSVDIAKFMTANHPFVEKDVKYLENDFSKFDKSQSQFAFDLESYVFQQLGLNQEMLDRWLLGHTECSLRSVTTGLSLHVLYQRKSGDATTAFGNVILNVLSVVYAYAGTEIVWAVFMGDDSLACARVVNGDSQAVQVMAEVFNLTAKFYITQAPYFASNFVVIDRARNQVRLLPDPVKRVEKLSMHVSGEDPQWHERHASLRDSLAGYSDPSSVAQLALVVPQRYQVSEGSVRGAASALGTLVNDFRVFRSLWSEAPEILQA